MCQRHWVLLECSKGRENTVVGRENVVIYETKLGCVKERKKERKKSEGVECRDVLASFGPVV